MVVYSSALDIGPKEKSIRIEGSGRLGKKRKCILLKYAKWSRSTKLTTANLIPVVVSSWWILEIIMSNRGLGFIKEVNFMNPILLKPIRVWESDLFY